MPEDLNEATIVPQPKNPYRVGGETVPVVVSDATGMDDGAHALNFPVVGIGASAGGLEAFVEFLAGLPQDTGMAYVIVSHLSTAHESHLVEILSRNTKLPVVAITDGLRCEPDHVYVLPPGVWVTLQDGELKLEPRPISKWGSKPIDHFFCSLAASQKNLAIGVVLSGTDSDGALGVRAIKGEGGIAIVQSPDSALFPDMPRNRIAAEQVDRIVPPGQMGAQLAELAVQYRMPELRPLEEGLPLEDDEAQLSKIFRMLRPISGLDFRNYKPTTLRRRLARRMMLLRIGSLPEYVKFLQMRPEERRTLHEDLLINVTRFFRDPETFAALKNIIFLKLLEPRSPDQQIRIWSAGCSTGEEVYSLAITLLECLAGKPIEPPIQIFGTDASESSIEKARVGLYSEGMVTEISPDRLRRYFVRTDGGYQISKRVRDLCIFARQNLCSDAPFSRLDLVSCRNVLIYLRPEIQHHIVATLNYSLRQNGYLLLGASESLRNYGDLFTPVDRAHKLYQRTSGVARFAVNLPSYDQLVTSAAASSPKPAAPENWSELELQRVTSRMTLARYGPPGVVVNERMQILQIHGEISPYLRVASGAPSLNLLRMANEDLLPTLRKALEQAIGRNIPVRMEGAHIHNEGQLRSVAVEVLPVQDIPTRPHCYLVLFVRSGESAKAEPLGPVKESAEVPSADRDRELLELRQEVSSTRMYLQSLIEERDARNQELTSAYEELQSSNEELQTAKEELQSTNEELQTVNEEMLDRNLALLQASNDLANLINSINIPVVMLGIDLKIRHFTPPTERLMNLRPFDIGRPIGEIRLNLKLESIEHLLTEVLDTLGTKEIEVQDRQDRWHLLRIRPYRTTDNRIDGLVLILVDVDQIRRGEEEMRAARDFAQRILECVQVPLCVLNEDLRIYKVNAAFCTLTQLSEEESRGRSFPELAALLWNTHGIRRLLEQAKAEPSADGTLEHKDGGGRVFKFSVQRVTDGNPTLLVTVEDITKQKQVEEALEQERQRLTGEVQMTAQALGRTRDELSALAASLFHSQEEERRRVARELHDDISQQLALLEVQAVEFQKSLPEELQDIKKQIRIWAERTGKVSEDVRLLSHGLHPSILDDLGLTPALRQMVREFGEREKMPATFESLGMTDELSREAATALYRIAQEALRNVAKHAGKTHVRVTLMNIESGIRMTVRDLGNGFDIGERQREGLGLLSMEERARLAGGTFRIESEVNAGTTVEVELPTASA